MGCITRTNRTQDMGGYTMTDKDEKTWRKDRNGFCLCQSLKQFRGCTFYPKDKPRKCKFLDLFGKCDLRIEAN